MPAVIATRNSELRRHPSLEAIHLLEPGPRAVDAGRISAVAVIFLVLSEPPPVELVVKSAAENRQPTFKNLPFEQPLCSEVLTILHSSKDGRP